jgi:membrane dipeptidase
MLMIDSHLDLAMNALDWNRDLEVGVAETRRREAGMTEAGRGRGTVAFPQMRQAELAVSVATVISRTARPESPASGMATQEISYAAAQGQLAYYRVLESQGKVRIIVDANGLQDHLQDWDDTGLAAPLGFIIGMEGADPIVSPEQAYSWWEDGLRVVGLSHYGVSAYAHGTGTDGGVSQAGFSLLHAMDSVGMILDTTHLADRAFWDALEHFEGAVLASHNNCRELVPGDRQYSDDQIIALIDRGGVIGVALDAWMLHPGWIKGETNPDVISLESVADHLDHICQLAGNSRHAAIGSDLDGGYGSEQTPGDLDTIVDLQRIPELMSARGYTDADCRGIMHGNWTEFFLEAWQD